MRITDVATNRQRIAALFLNIIALSFGLGSIPFISEGLKNLVHGVLIWSFGSFGLAGVLGMTAIGLWQWRLWARTVALCTSVVAISLLPMLVTHVSITVRAANPWTFVVASLFSLFGSLSVYLLTRPETKGLFGLRPTPVDKEFPESQSPDVSQSKTTKRPIIRKLRFGVITAAILFGNFVIWDVHSLSVQKNVDARVVADIHELMEQELASLKADDPIIRHYGSFRGWERGDWNRPRYLGMLISRLATNGTAHFQRADVKVTIIITAGSKAILLRNSSSDVHDRNAWSHFWDYIGATHPEFDPS